MKMCLPPVSQIIRVLLKHSHGPAVQAAPASGACTSEKEIYTGSLDNTCVLPEGGQCEEKESRGQFLGG